MLEEENPGTGADHALFPVKKLMDGLERMKNHKEPYCKSNGFMGVEKYERKVRYRHP